MRSAIVLTACGLLAAFLVSLVAEQTRERVADNQQRLAMQTVNTVLPDGPFDAEPHTDIMLFSDPELTSGRPLPAYRARRNGELVATALTVIAPDGYVGPIKLLVGIDAVGELIAVRALEHRETPGLGDRIDTARSDWILQLAGPTPPAGWLLERDGGTVDQISGATITSRATLGAITRALDYYAAHRDELTQTAAE